MSLEIQKIDSLPPAGLNAALESGISALPCDNQKQIIFAALNKKLQEYAKIELTDGLIDVISYALTISGQKQDPATLAIYADEFYSALMQRFPRLSLEEVKLAIRKGIYEEYGEYYGINVKSFMFFVTSFVNSIERKEAKINMQSKMLKAPEKVLSPEETRRDNCDFVNYLFADYQKNALIVDYIPIHVYPFLEDEKKIVLTVEEKKAIYKRAEQYYKQLKFQGKTPLIRLASLTADTELQFIKNIARQFAVYEFFEAASSEGLSVIFNNQH